MHKYSKYFVKMAFLKEEDTEIRRVLRSINTLRVEVAYPLLLEMYDDYTNEKLSRESFISILKLIESYVFRRLICGISTNSLNKTFATFSRDIDKTSVREKMKKYYIAYKTTTNFVDIVPQKNRLRLSLHMEYGAINDPKGLTRDITNVGRWGNGDVDIGISSPEQLEDIMALIRQSYELHREDPVEQLV